MRMVTNTYKTLRKLSTMAMLSVVGLFASYTAQGQDCPLVCNNLIQVSLDSECSATISPDMVLEGVDMEIEDMTCDFFIILEDENGNEIDRTRYVNGDTPGTIEPLHPSVSGDQIGQTISIGIWADGVPDNLVDLTASNNCWSAANIEDKIPNSIDCPTDPIILPCYDNLSIAEIQTANSESDGAGSPTQVTDGTPAMVTVPVTNSALAFELINTVELVVFAVDGAGANIPHPSMLVSLTSPGGITSAPQVPTMMTGVVIFNDFFGVQTTDANVSGDWILTVDFSSAIPVDYTVTTSEVTISSLSVLSNSFDQDNCSDGDIMIVSDESFDTDCRDENEPFTMRRLITYSAGDGGAECVLTIDFLKTDLDEIDGPDNVIVSCANDSNNDGTFDDIFILFDDNEDGVLQPEETGVPTINGSSIFPLDFDNPCRFNVSFDDQLFESCASNFKIIRTFTIFDWCNAEVRDITQIIEQADDVPPVLVCPGLQVMEVDSDASGCGATFTLDPLSMSDENSLGILDFIFDCSAEYEVVGVGYLEANPDGSVPDAGIEFEFDQDVIENNDGTFTLVGLEGPRVWIQYIIADGCGNVTRFPVADGVSSSNTCTLEVDIIDITPPVAICDEFTAVALNDDGWGRVRAESLDDGSYDFCGEVTFQVRRLQSNECTALSQQSGYNDLAFGDFIQVCCADVGNDVMVELLVSDESGNTSSCMVTVRAQDKSNPVVVSCPGDVFLSCTSNFVLNDPNASGPTLADNCGFGDIFPLDNDNRDDCGAGTVTRSWRLRNADGSSTNLGCTQTITFSLQTIDEFDIVYPGDLVDNNSLLGCMTDVTDPADTGVPTFGFGSTPIEEAPGCGNIAVTFTDQVFSDVADACFKIIRTWTIIDWCVYETNDPTGDGFFQGFQTIMLNNDDAPVFTQCGSDNDMYCLTGENCDINVSFNASADDGCTGDQITESSRYLWTIRSGSSVVSTGFGRSASDRLEVGSYTIDWTVVGACDIAASCSQSFTVEDCTPPTPYCRGGVTTVILPGEQSVTVWASDLNLGSEDQCDNPITFTFEDGSANMEFTCDDLGENEVVIVITDPSGNTDFCTTTVTIQSNNGSCGSSSRIMIGGNVATEAADGIMDVEVSLQHMEDATMEHDMSLENGTYAFEDVFSLEDYHLTAVKDGDARNGVSTLDIILIQRHLLNIEPLDSPFKMIAADANDSESVTAADMVDIRKLILEIYDEFPNNKSWRFVDSQEEYQNVLNPWPLQEDILLSNILTDDLAVNWTGIKVGDVNGSVTLNGLKGSATDVRGDLTFGLTAERAEDGQYIIRNTEVIDLTGLQMEVAMSNVASISSEVLDLQPEHYVISNDGLGVSYSQLTPTTIPAGSIIFRVTAEAQTSMTLGGGIIAEAYNQDLTILPITLSQSVEATEGFALYQNQPNPFSDITSIGFDLPRAGSANLEIMDINGRVIYSITQQLGAGTHVQSIDASILPSAGLMYYRLNFEGEVQTKKMILLD